MSEVPSAGSTLGASRITKIMFPYSKSVNKQLNKQNQIDGLMSKQMRIHIDE